ncbi:T-cell activation inhibitor, mitochondrial-like [Balaenoptera ricei]|uniref:T-cell activation inhibitor, mitochondrial-like n=1 Tax=Balaenoptera ricei TaxID=2746895 RepID=UPI0028BEFBEC|nr:T-cell activation inhibitor, mitochondrial-like [Balaenoptera ricei]
MIGQCVKNMQTSGYQGEHGPMDRQVLCCPLVEFTSPQGSSFGQRRGIRPPQAMARDRGEDCRHVPPAVCCTPWVSRSRTLLQTFNENSLKRLSAYLENLQKSGFKSLKPTQLVFYVRETDRNSSDGQEHFSTSGFRAVKFTLHTRDLLSTVLYILNSCSLSIEHIQSLNTNVHSQPLKEAKRISDRPIKWDKSYYSFTGFKDPDEDLEQVWRMETTLTSWLDNNGKSAVKKLKNSLPLRKELDRLKDELSHQLQLSDIRWQRSWGIAHRCSQLHSLGRLAQQNLESLKNAKGCTIIFTDRSGMSAVGHVMLGTMDVHHHWTKLFERLPSYFDLQRRLMLLEDQISYLLGGIQVVYIEELQPVLTLEEYYSLLDVFYNRLLKSRIPFHPRSLCSWQMILNRN